MPSQDSNSTPLEIWLTDTSVSKEIYRLHLQGLSEALTPMYRTTQHDMTEDHNIITHWSENHTSHTYMYLHTANNPCDLQLSI
jgi:hypothetical protein